MKARELCASLVMIGLLFSTSRADDQSGVDKEVFRRTISRAIGYLRTKGQASDGSYSTETGIGVTALVTTALLRHGVAPGDPQVAASLEYLLKNVQDDGGIYRTGSAHGNYETSLAVLCFKEANRDGKYDQLLRGADAFLKGGQWDEGEGKERTDPAFGGAGYGSKRRPDLSNTSFFIEALKAIGNAEDDEAIQKALIFISRCQNLESEHNTLGFAVKNPDGGFIYTAVGPDSMAGKLENGGLRSYASMTYTGLKSMIHAGVGPDDPRVKAALRWIKEHYALDANPGMGTAGLYYYYHTFAKALDAVGEPKLVDAQGRSHDWRAELVAELAKRQAADGSWTNVENERWLEKDANLVSGYALLALSYCKP